MDRPHPKFSSVIFKSNVSVKISGARLIDLPMGMQPLESNLLNANEITVGAHGGSSEGYEWVYPLKDFRHSNE